MSARGSSGKHWAVAGGIAGGLAVAMLLLLRVSSRGPAGAENPALPAPAAGVGFAHLDRGDGDSLLDQEAMFRDPTPLFLPTKRNATEGIVADRLRRDASAGFRGYAPKTVFAESALGLTFPSPVPVPERPAESFASDQPARPFGGLGESEWSVLALKERAAYVEVLGAGDGKRVWEEALSAGGVSVPAEAAWEPLEFLVAVNAMGAVRPLLLTESSRVREVDAFFREYLLRGLRIGARLRPGFYRICIGP